MNAITHVHQKPTVTGEAILPEPVGLAPPSAKATIEGALLQSRLDRQVSSAHSHTLAMTKGPLAVYGFPDVDLATLLGPMDERQLGRLRELGTFNVADLASLVGRLDHETLARLTDISELGDTDLNRLVNEVARQSGAEEPGSSGFDPRGLEKHFGVLLMAIITFNLARVANAQLRGHFSVMSANAAVEQGKAIREGGNASLYSSLGMAIAAGSLSGGSLVLSLKSFQARQADINTNRSDALEAGRLQADLRKDLHDPEQLSVLTPKEQEVYRHSLEGLISDVGLRQEKAQWLSQLASRNPDQLAAIGNSLSSVSTVVSNVVSASIRLEEIAQNERGVLQQSNQNVQKGLAEEQAQVDARDAALLQKLMDLLQQLSLSRNSVIDAVVRA